MKRWVDGGFFLNNGPPHDSNFCHVPAHPPRRPSVAVASCSASPVYRACVLLYLVFGDLLPVSPFGNFSRLVGLVPLTPVTLASFILILGAPPPFVRNSGFPFPMRCKLLVPGTLLALTMPATLSSPRSARLLTRSLFPSEKVDAGWPFSPAPRAQSFRLFPDRQRFRAMNEPFFFPTSCPSPA